jgi:DNA-binding MarR family transcriptional regulator
MIKKNINASVIFHVIRLSETWKKNGEMITRKYGITTQQWLILLLLANDPNIIYLQENPQEKPLMAKELADAMNVSRANITNLLNVLLKKKLVVQVADSVDKRRKRLVLSKAGEKVVSELETIRIQKNNKLLSAFSKAEKQNFIGFIKICLAAMKKD